MNFSKVKLVICVSLLIVNVIFAFMNIKILADKNYISEEEVQLAEKHLAKSGIDYKFEKESRRLYELPIYALEENEDDGIPGLYKRMTETFFDTVTDESAYVKIPEGYSISVKNEEGVLLGSASLGGKTRFECYREGAVEAKDINEISRAPHTVQLTVKKGDRTKIASDYIADALKGYGTKYVYCGEREYNNGTIVSFRTEFSDIAAVNLYLNVYVSKNRVLCCAGNISDVTVSKKYSCDVIDSVNILYMLKDYDEGSYRKKRTENLRIKRIEMTYKMYEGGSEVKYLIPSWVIEYAEGIGKSEIVVMDALTGKNVEVLR